MNTMMATPSVDFDEEHLTLRGISWSSYVTISDALPERSGVRLIYRDGRLTFLTVSRRHDWFVEILGLLVIAVANGCDIVWELAGQATFRHKDAGVGAEGDRTYYFRDHAEIMHGPVNIDLAMQPPPDLAIEVEVSHPADEAMIVWGRLGVPEVWRFDPDAWTFGFWLKRDDGSYEPAPRSLAFPILETSDVIGQMRLVEELGPSRWSKQLPDWVRDTLVPKLEKPAIDG